MKATTMVTWKDGQPGCMGWYKFGCKKELARGMVVWQDDTYGFWCPSCGRKENKEIRWKAKKVAPVVKALVKVLRDHGQKVSADAVEGTSLTEIVKALEEEVTE